LRCGAGEQREGGDGNEERTHLLWPPGLFAAPRLSVPGTDYARKPV
jgi:hypothetical protein